MLASNRMKSLILFDNHARRPFRVYAREENSFPIGEETFHKARPWSLRKQLRSATTVLTTILCIPSVDFEPKRLILRTECSEQDSLSSIAVVLGIGFHFYKCGKGNPQVQARFV